MCGIAGIIGQGANIDTLHQMLYKIKHRGEKQYFAEFASLPNVTIGTNRLAIVDPLHGKQPFYSEDKRIICILNGEIYNHKELKAELEHEYNFNSSCDAETIIYSYMKWGTDFIDKIDGEFALCLVDIKKNKYFIARDHLGVKALYYCFHKDTIFFASELKAFSDFPAETVIYTLEAGKIMMNSNIYTYYKLPKFNPDNSTPEEKSLQKLRIKLENAVQKMLPDTNQKVACLLSGGVDSSTILYLIHKLHHGQVEAFTFANLHNESQDLAHAKIICNQLNIKLNIVSPTIEELTAFYLKQGVFMVETYECALVRNAVSYYFLCKAVRMDGYKFCLSGEGADEIFGGYDYFKLLPIDKQDNAIRESLQHINKSYLQMADRASMYATLEVRVPYMDKTLVNYIASLSTKYRIWDNNDKWGLRNLYLNDMPRLITQRSKAGMNFGGGFGSNDPGESIYYKAVDTFYALSHTLDIDKTLCLQEFPECKIDMANIEEIYNLARFIELKYHRLTHSELRLQLNTSKLVFDLT